MRGRGSLHSIAAAQRRCIVIGAWTPDHRVIMRVEQQDFALTRTFLACGDEVGAANAGNIIFESLNGVGFAALMLWHRRLARAAEAA